MTNTEALLEQAAQYKSQIAKLQETFALVAAKKPVPTVLQAALRAMIKNGYVVIESGKPVFTQRGKLFSRSMKKPAPVVSKILK